MFGRVERQDRYETIRGLFEEVSKRNLRNQLAELEIMESQAEQQRRTRMLEQWRAGLTGAKTQMDVLALQPQALDIATEFGADVGRVATQQLGQTYESLAPQETVEQMAEREQAVSRARETGKRQAEAEFPSPAGLPQNFTALAPGAKARVWNEAYPDIPMTANDFREEGAGRQITDFQFFVSRFMKENPEASIDQARGAYLQRADAAYGDVFIFDDAGGIAVNPNARPSAITAARTNINNNLLASRKMLQDLRRQAQFFTEIEPDVLAVEEQVRMFEQMFNALNAPTRGGVTMPNDEQVIGMVEQFMRGDVDAETLRMSIQPYADVRHNPKTGEVLALDPSTGQWKTLGKVSLEPERSRTDIPRSPGQGRR
jgi:hypothetical protein